MMIADRQTGNPEDYLQDKDDPLYWQMRQENEGFLRRQQWGVHYGNGTLQRQRQGELQRLAQEAEQIVAERVETMGYQATLTTHKCPFDLWICNKTGRVIRVEVKLSRYRPHKRGGRYQANIRHDQADLLVFMARNGRDWPFIIPMADIAPRRHIAIWATCPDDHSGQWTKYLEAWNYLHLAIEQAQSQPWQPSLF